MNSIASEIAGNFDPLFVKKNQTHLTGDLKSKIIAFYTLGNSHHSIVMHLKDFHDDSKKELLGLYIEVARY